jgi:osmoprotectant transport system substrate-binding protein
MKGKNVRRPSISMLALLVSLLLLVTACGGDDLGSGTVDEGGDAAAGDGTEAAATGGGTETAGGNIPEPGSESLEGATITVGSKDFDEQLVLGNISKVALEAAGATVNDQINLGGTDAARSALVNGEIDHYWEYTGTAWISFFGNAEPIPDRQEQWEAVRQQDWSENSLVWLEPAQFNNTYGLAYRSEAAEDLGNPQTISDIGTLIEENPDAATLCVETEFESRDDGLPGLEETYGFEFPEGNVTVLDTGVVYSATDQGDPCNFGEVFTTDGRIAANDLTVLEDDQGFFPLYNATPVFRGELYTQYGQALQDVFNPIAQALTQDAMTELNARVSAEGERPEAVAQDFLESNDLLPQ